jgi:uncharacterized protein YcbK (DUF882 family)
MRPEISRTDRQAPGLRDRLGKPLIVRSAYRSPEHNRAVGGATQSKHMDGRTP